MVVLLHKLAENTSLASELEYQPIMNICGRSKARQWTGLLHLHSKMCQGHRSQVVLAQVKSLALSCSNGCFCLFFKLGHWEPADGLYLHPMSLHTDTASRQCTPLCLRSCHDNPGHFMLSFCSVVTNSLVQSPHIRFSLIYGSLTWENREGES